MKLYLLAIPMDSNSVRDIYIFNSRKGALACKQFCENNGLANGKALNLWIEEVDTDNYKSENEDISNPPEDQF